MMEQLDANDLLLFARIAEAGSFNRAAERVGLPRSTVSRRIALLEARLGERLILRTTRQLSLTEFGQALLDHARQVADEVAAAEALAQHRQAEPRGRLRVSMPGDFANLVLADLLARFVERHPAVTLELDLSPRRVDLLAENFDLAIRMGELPDDASLAARQVATFSAGLYASPAYAVRHGLPERPEDLERHRTLGLPARGKPVSWVLGRGKTRVEVAPQACITANSPDLLVILARRGSGITAVPDHYAAPIVARGDLVRILPDWCLPSAPAWAVFPGRRLMPAKTRVFLDMLAEELPDGTANRPGRGKLAGR